MKTVTFITAVLFLSIAFSSCTCSSSSSPGDSGSDPYGDFVQVEYTDSVIPWDGPICGNRIVEAGEECDDGNRRACDGCSMNCRVELFECPGPDAESEADSGGDAAQEAQPPPAPEPIGETIVVSDPSDNPGDAGGAGEILHVLWTGSYFSIVYFRSCLADSPAIQCLGMRRFDETGRVIGPDWVYEPVELTSGPSPEIGSFDYCWNGDGYGLAWTEGYSVYFMRLNSDGKPLGSPVKECDRCLETSLDAGMLSGLRIGCKQDEYLLTYRMEVSIGTYWLWLQELDAMGTPGEGAFLGEELAALYMQGLKSFRSDWVLLHETTAFENDPPGRRALMLEDITGDLAFAWRSFLDQGNDFWVDYDVYGDRAMITFPDGDDESALLVVDLDDGSLASGRALEGVMPRISQTGEGSAAILKVVHGEWSLSRIYLSAIDEQGLESDEVLVQEMSGDYFSCYTVPYDAAWTGSEIGVVMALPRSDPELMRCDFLLRMFTP